MISLGKFVLHRRIGTAHARTNAPHVFVHARVYRQIVLVDAHIRCILPRAANVRSLLVDV